MVDKIATMEYNPLIEEAVGGAYEGASKTSQEIAMWSPSSLSADQEILIDKVLLDSRSKDLMRNDGYLSGAIDTHKDSIVGSQFVLNAKPTLEVLQRISRSFDETWMEEFQQDTESQFKLWGESPEGWPDASRTNTFTGLIRLGVGISVYAGEILASSEWINRVGNPFKTAIQMIDVDRLSNPNNIMDSNRLSGGVEKDRYGAPTHYHIRNNHPSEWNDPRSHQWKRIPARKPWGRRQIIHIHEQQRPAQTRSVAGIVSTLKEMKMTKRYSDVVLQNAVMNATFAATIESELPPEATYQQLTAGNSGGDYASRYMEQVAAYMGSANNIKVDGARIPHLWPGQKLNLQNPANPGGMGDKFEASMLRRIAASLGLSYEQFSKDYTQTNYSSARASFGETQKLMQSRKKTFADRFASLIYQLWFEEAINSGRIILPSGVSPSIFYEGQYKDALTSCSWIGASVGQIDPLKETKAALMRIEGGISTYEAEAAKLGGDFREIFAQLQREKRIMEQRGLNMSSSSTSEPTTEEPDNGDR